MAKRRCAFLAFAWVAMLTARAWAADPGEQGSPCDNVNNLCNTPWTCTDGYCCNTTCGKGCEVCNGNELYGGSFVNGTCATRPPGAVGRLSCNSILCISGPNCTGSCGGNDELCAPGTYCPNITCVTGQPVGSGCQTQRQCASGFCVRRDGVDGPIMPGTTGVCCDHECQGGPCDACTRALTGSTQDGQCGNVLSLMDQGPQACSPAEAPATCGRTGYCDGKGQCAFYPKGMVVGDPICRWNDGGPGVASVTQSCDGVGGCICDAFTCISGMCMDGVCLPSPDAGDSGDASIGTGEDAPGDATQDVSSAEDGGDAGSDASPKTVSCAPYAGEPGHCLKECRTQADCVAPAKCHVDGTCGPGFPGERCWLNGEAGVFLPDGGCVPGSPDDPPEVVGVCSMTSRRHGASNAPWVLAALLGIWRARRRRSIPV